MKHSLAQHNQKFESVRNHFRLENPLFSRILEKTKLVVLWATAAITVAVGAISPWGCSVKPEQPDQQAQQQPQEIASGYGKVDSLGNMTFDLDGITYKLTVSDAETHEKIGGLDAFLVSNGVYGYYLLFDSSGKYPPAFVGFKVGESADVKADAVVWKETDTNVMMYKKDESCSFGLSDWVQYGNPTSIEQLFLSQNKDDSLLKQTFEKIPEPVTLAELGSVLQKLFEEAKSEAISKGIEKITKLEFGVVGVLGTIIGVCNDANQLSWSQYYGGLCYNEDDKFNIWKLKLSSLVGISTKAPDKDGKNSNMLDKNIEIPVLLENPIFLVLPRKPPNNDWSPPVSSILGEVWTTDDMKLPPTSVTVERPSDLVGIIQPLTKVPGKNVSTFHFVLGACHGFTDYVVGVKDPLSGTKTKATLNVEKDMEYTVAFEIDRSCGNSYDMSYKDNDTDGYGNKLKIRVSCKQLAGYVSDDTDCDDSDPKINPKGKEVCGDKKDNNCNGEVDEGCDNIVENEMDASIASDVEVSSETNGIDALDDTENVDSETSSVGFDCPGLNPEYCSKVIGKKVFQIQDVLGRVIVDDMYVYVPVEDFGIYVMSKNLQQLTLGNSGVQLPKSTIVNNGVIYGLTYDATLKAYFSDNKLYWTSDLPDVAWTGLALGTNGIMYTLADFGSTLASVDIKNGKTLNKVNEAATDILIGFGGELLLTSGSGGQTTFKRFSPTLDKLAEFQIIPSIDHSRHISMASDGTIYVITSDQYVDAGLRAVGQDGKIKWKYIPKDGEIDSAPLIGENGDLYFTITNANTGEVRLERLDSKGNQKWKSVLDAKSASSYHQDLILSADGSIYVKTIADTFLIDKNGNQVAKIDNGTSDSTMMTLTKEGILYYTTITYAVSHILYAINVGTPLMNSSWPMYRHDPQNTGNVNTPLQ